MAGVFVILSVAASLAGVGVLPAGVDLGVSQQAARMALPGVQPGQAAPPGAFSLMIHMQVEGERCAFSVYGRGDRVTDIGMTDSTDRSGEFFARLSSKVSAALGPATVAKSGDMSWRKGSETVLLYRGPDGLTQLSIAGSDSVWRLD